jgi:ribosomal protein L18E
MLKMNDINETKIMTKNEADIFNKFITNTNVKIEKEIMEKLFNSTSNKKVLNLFYFILLKF